MEHAIKKIGILTSGGDAPGMNAAIYAIVKAGLKRNLEVFGIMDGYKGLIEDQIFPLQYKDVENIVSKGGTILGSARLPEFKEVEVQKKAVEILNHHGIDALVCIGGDGTYMGGLRLSELGIRCIGVPGTIDNDIPSTEYTIGFDTCLNTIVESIDKLRDTAGSHHRCIIVEVMGRYCPDLALRGALSCEAEYVLYSKEMYDENEMLKAIQVAKDHGKKEIIIVVAEHTIPVDELEKVIQEKTDLDPRCTVLGHVQRGGRPSAFDRVLAIRLGIFAVDLLCKGETGKCVGVFGEQLKATNILEANRLPKKQAQEIKPCVQKI